MKILKARNFAPLAPLPALSLTAYQLEWVDRGSLEVMMRLVAVVIPLDQMVSSSNIRRQSAVYYAFAFPQIPVFMVYVIGEIKYSNWFRTTCTKTKILGANRCLLGIRFRSAWVCKFRRSEH